MGLDKFGYPATYMANSVLTELNDFGDETRQLESSWYEWLNYNPFDTQVAIALAALYRKRLVALDGEIDADRIQRLQRKLEITENRIARYHDLRLQNRFEL